jgi:predicted transcriptional regulator
MRISKSIRVPQDVTAAELAILEKLWEHESASVKDLSQWLSGASTPSDVATVQKLLSRLEAKGCVGRDRESWPHLFHATIAREDLISQRLQATADELSDGTLTTLLTHLVQSKKFTAKQRQRLRQMLDEMDEK